MLKWYEYSLFKKVYELNTTMDNEQRYPHHFISDIANTTKTDVNDVLSMLKAFKAENYVCLIENTNSYIHTAAITAKGVSTLRHFKNDWWWQLARNILIPAVVSVVCSLVVYMVTN